MVKKKFTLQALEKELKEHDWTYEMSDDHSYWTSGTNHRKIIKHIIQGLQEQGMSKKTSDLFYKYYPVNGCHEVKGYGINHSWAEHLDRKAMEYNG